MADRDAELETLRARVEELEAMDKACEEQRVSLIEQKTALEARLRAVSEALEKKLIVREHTSIRDFHRPIHYYGIQDVDSRDAKLRAIVEGK